jgi:hypothetical protein
VFGVQIVWLNLSHNEDPTDFGLEKNEWFTKRFDIRDKWIPA